MSLQEGEARRRVEAQREARLRVLEAARAAGGSERAEPEEAEYPWEVARREVRRSHGEGHLRLAPLDVAPRSTRTPGFCSAQRPHSLRLACTRAAPRL